MENLNQKERDLYFNDTIGLLDSKGWFGHNVEKIENCYKECVTKSSNKIFNYINEMLAESDRKLERILGPTTLLYAGLAFLDYSLQVKFSNPSGNFMKHAGVLLEHYDVNNGVLLLSLAETTALGVAYKCKDYLDKAVTSLDCGIDSLPLIRLMPYYFLLSKGISTHIEIINSLIG
ncbi:MAG: hypothetical protein KAS32_06045 [Candidatus Peribacteraceae bacterium]|nr:hypothetical protein [Candidatus Peribacteraceae bacterium]